jgi:DNA uptake protein ComE-like DNA-binding protein
MNHQSMLTQWRHFDQHRCANRNWSSLPNRSGVILVVVLVVVALLSLAAYTFAELMLTHYRAAQMNSRRLQTRMLVQSGADAIKLYLIQDETAREEAGGHINNPAYFQAIPVVLADDPADRANFTVLAPNIDDQGYLSGVRYGLEDESTRLNLNALMLAEQSAENAGRELLMGLPGMTEDVADAILDWIDEDEEPREFGVESDYYMALDPPYAAKNGPLDTVEELLLVAGVTPQLLFGTDTNRNGNVDAHEISNRTSAAPGQEIQILDDISAESGSLDRGWSGYLTLYSMEKNVSSTGVQRIDLNMDDLEQLYDLLAEINESWAKFIVAYRQYGPYDGNEEGEDAGSLEEPDFSKPAQEELTQVLDLIGKKVQISPEGDEESIVLAPAFPEGLVEMAVYMPILMDHVTINSDSTIPGRININRAPLAILEGIPGLEIEVVEEILSQRSLMLNDEGSDVSAYRHETWLLTSGLVTLDEMKALSPLINAGGDIFRAQIVGYFEDGGAASRVEVIFDATEALPRILSWRDISHLGRGYPLETLGLQFMENF